MKFPNYVIYNCHGFGQFQAERLEFESWEAVEEYAEEHAEDFANGYALITEE